ncbi:MAG: hypothetical protein GWM87_06775 [Xanthomonadales bacterium]|nr:hypothetical protein [Xanthomonadales bacterium]NIX12669.1 hypothetical protein [Xanthomonadales bacterium]
MRIVKFTLIAVLALLALNAVAYGLFFVVSPADGLREFAVSGAVPVTPGTLHLVSLAGIGFLGFAGFAVLAAALLLQGKGNGAGVAAVLGATYLAIGLHAISIGLRVDALIYGGFGVLTCLFSALLWRLTTRERAHSPSHVE